MPSQFDRLEALLAAHDVELHRYVDSYYGPCAYFDAGEWTFKVRLNAFHPDRPEVYFEACLTPEQIVEVLTPPDETAVPNRLARVPQGLYAEADRALANAQASPDVAKALLHAAVRLAFERGYQDGYRDGHADAENGRDERVGASTS